MKYRYGLSLSLAMSMSLALAMELEEQYPSESAEKAMLRRSPEETYLHRLPSDLRTELLKYTGFADFPNFDLLPPEVKVKILESYIDNEHKKETAYKVLLVRLNTLLQAKEFEDIAYDTTINTGLAKYIAQIYGVDNFYKIGLMTPGSLAILKEGIENEADGANRGLKERLDDAIIYGQYATLSRTLAALYPDHRIPESDVNKILYARVLDRVIEWGAFKAFKILLSYGAFSFISQSNKTRTFNGLVQGSISFNVSRDEELFSMMLADDFIPTQEARTWIDAINLQLADMDRVGLKPEEKAEKIAWMKKLISIFETYIAQASEDEAS